MLMAKASAIQKSVRYSPRCGRRFSHSRDLLGSNIPPILLLGRRGRYWLLQICKRKWLNPQILLRFNRALLLRTSYEFFNLDRLIYSHLYLQKSREAPITLSTSPSASIHDASHTQASHAQLKKDRERRRMRAASHVIAWGVELRAANADIAAGERRLEKAKEMYKRICDTMPDPPSSDDEAPLQKRRKVASKPRVPKSKPAAADVKAKARVVATK